MDESHTLGSGADPAPGAVVTHKLQKGGRLKSKMLIMIAAIKVLIHHRALPAGMTGDVLYLVCLPNLLVNLSTTHIMAMLFVYRDAKNMLL